MEYEQATLYNNHTVFICYPYGKAVWEHYIADLRAIPPADPAKPYGEELARIIEAERETWERYPKPFFLIQETSTSVSRASQR